MLLTLSSARLRNNICGQKHRRLLLLLSTNPKINYTNSLSSRPYCISRILWKDNLRRTIESSLISKWFVHF